MKKPSPSEITLFLRHIATLYSAGIPLAQIFDLLASLQTTQQMQDMQRTIKHHLESGRTLAHSLNHYPQTFDAFTCHLIHAGEQSGTLDIMLDRIVQHKEQRLQIIRKLKQAFTYPTLVILFAIVLCIIMLAVIVPRFEELFISAHADLPRLTRWVVKASHCLRHTLFLVTLLLLLMPLLPTLLHRAKQLPFIQSMTLPFQLTHFLRTLAILQHAGIPLIESLPLLHDIHLELRYRHAIGHLTHHLNHGRQLHAAMHIIPYFPPWLVQMVKVGEESGSLERMLDKAAEMYESEIDFLINHLSQVIEPLIIIGLGVLIGGLVIAMYLPIFKLGMVI